MFSDAAHALLLYVLRFTHYCATSPLRPLAPLPLASYNSASMTNSTTRNWRTHVLERQVARLGRRLAEREQHNGRLATLRLGLFLGGLGLTAVAFYYLGNWGGSLVGLVVVVAFVTAVSAHSRVKETISQHQIWQQIKATHLARQSLAWDELPPPQTFTVDKSHPFAYDLNLVGNRSLHRLLDTAVSQEGSARLADWLLDNNPDYETAQARQQLVRELLARPRFRDKLMLHGTAVTADMPDDKWPGQRLLDWLQHPSSAAGLRPLTLALSGWSAINIIWILLALFSGWPPYWGVSVLLFLATYFLLAQRYGLDRLFSDVLFLESSLRQLGGVFHFLENNAYKPYPHLARLCAPFWQAQNRPSRQLRHVTRLLAAAGLQRNPLVHFLLNALLPWDFWVSHRLAERKKELADILPGWLDIWFELEALSSLATFAYLNPDYTFAQLHPPGSKPLLLGQNLGHPLIHHAERVGNDFTISRPGELAIITGSNMAGKSSFLRTLGVVVRLGLAGTAVPAQSFSLQPLRLFTSIQVQDSLADGFSFFYAEVRRLRALLDALPQSKTPLLYLIDEIFRGTNNRERLIGSRAYVRALVEANGEQGTGLIATHDLELTSLAEETPAITNYHFRDDVENGRMVFDYKLHPGPCPTTNALRVMALAGLPVGGAADKQA
jgi:hypothetical protein